MVDWMMELPNDLEIEFHEEVERIENEHRKPYVTSIERRGIETGVKTGIKTGIKTGVKRGIKKGVEKGVLIGRVQVFQELLGVEISANENLTKLKEVDLRQEVERLRALYLAERDHDESN
jgi:hypothetical protein